MRRTFAWLLALWVGVALEGAAHAQPLDGDCDPETGAVRTLVNDVGAAVRARPTVREFAERAMEKILADKEAKDRWGYTSHTGDGCFARSYATGYDISQGVFGPVPPGMTHKTIYIYWKNFEWTYHTAAVISGPDGDFVLDGLNRRVLTMKEWEEYWKKGEFFDRIEVRNGIHMHDWEPVHDGKPNLERRLEAQRWINARKELVNRPTYPYEPPTPEELRAAAQPPAPAAARPSLEDDVRRVLNEGRIGPEAPR